MFILKNLVNPVYNHLRLQVLHDEVEHHLPHVFQQQRIRHAVPRLRIKHQLKLLPCLLQLVDKLNRVLHVDVVVDGAVNQ